MVPTTDGLHLSDEVILSAVHRQLPAADLVHQHLDSCAACSSRHAQFVAHEREVGALLGQLDHAPGSVVDVAPLLLRRRRQARLRRAVAILGPAATFALAAAAIVVPTSPIHQWLEERRQPSASQIPPAAGPTADPPFASGIAFPAPAALVIEFTHPQQGGMIELTRREGRDVAFRSRGGHTSYTVGTGRVVIDNQQPAEAYLIDLPTGVQNVRIIVDHAVMLRWPEDSSRFTIGHDPMRVQLSFPARGIP